MQAAALLAAKRHRADLGGQRRGNSMQWYAVVRNRQEVIFQDLKYTDQAKTQLDEEASSKAAVALAKNYFTAGPIAKRGHKTVKTLTSNSVWAAVVESQCVTEDCNYRESIRIPHGFDGLEVRLMCSAEKHCGHRQERQATGLTAEQKAEVNKIRAGADVYKKNVGPRRVLQILLQAAPKGADGKPRSPPARRRGRQRP